MSVLNLASGAPCTVEVIEFWEDYKSLGLYCNGIFGEVPLLVEVRQSFLSMPPISVWCGLAEVEFLFDPKKKSAMSAMEP